MSDTDVYRLQYRYTQQDDSWSDWLPCASRTHSDGLYTSLASARRSLLQQPHEYDYRIQKLGVRVFSHYADGSEVVDYVELGWTDVNN